MGRFGFVWLCERRAKGLRERQPDSSAGSRDLSEFPGKPHKKPGPPVPGTMLGRAQPQPSPAWITARAALPRLASGRRPALCCSSPHVQAP